METFLDLLIKDIFKNHNSDFSKLCCVFPTRRAALIFRNKFAAQLNKPVWSPSALSIEDFIQSLNEAPIVKDFELLFTLFEVYKNYFPDVSFEKFHHWGEIMIRDFNEIDLQLIDADKIFSGITEIKRIDAEFGLADEEVQRITEFWKNFSGQELSKLKKEFLIVWKSLPGIYHDFRKSLYQKEMMYDGMASRHLLEQLQNDKIEIKWNKIIFAGFYALSNAHEQIIGQLKKKSIADVYWDADEYYTNDNLQEAGAYFRKKKLPDENFKWNHNYFETGKKNITITGVPLRAGQAKYLGNLLEQILNKDALGKTIDEAKTAVILPDENLLLPVLYSMPSGLTSFNVTMGYPLKNSLVRALIELLYFLQKHIRENEKTGISFYTADVVRLLQHPYVQLLDEVTATEKINRISKLKKIYCTANGLSEKDNAQDFVASLFFKKLSSAEDVFKYVHDVLEACSTHTISSKQLNYYEKEIILFVCSELNLVSKTIKPHSQYLSTETSWQFIRKTIDKLKVPFSGEPVEGLQIMGFLETRALDFENLFILSVNEDILPASSKGGSFIPYSLRKSFGLPSFDDYDSVHAYHFYRLMQRAKNIHLIYNTEVKSLTGGERSRFLLQINYELKKKLGKNIALQHQLVTAESIAEKENAISITKTDEIIEILNQKFLLRIDDDSLISPKNNIGFSASSLSTYINCPLQFYFRYVAGIKETETVEETMEADTLGKILHGAMQRLYANNKKIDSVTINDLLKKTHAAVDESYAVEYPNSSEEASGKNHLLKQVIYELAAKILNADLQTAPFNIETVEGKFGYGFKYHPSKPAVLLKGVFDRVDEVNGLARIIDYKSGSDELSPETPFEKIFSIPKFKASFQLYYYSYIYKQLNPQKKLQAGIYRLKSISEGLSYLSEKAEIPDVKLQEFEDNLEELINEILNPQVNFSQTSDEKRCRNCPYKEICNR